MLVQPLLKIDMKDLGAVGEPQAANAVMMKETSLNKRENKQSSCLHGGRARLAFKKTCF